MLKKSFFYFINRKIKFFTNSLRMRSIQSIITACLMLVTILVMTFVSIVLYNKFTDSAEQSAAINTKQVIEQVNTNLDYYLRTTMEISYALKDIVNSYEDVHNKKLAEEMNVIMSTRKDIVSLALFSDKGDLVEGVPINYLKPRANITQQDWFKAPMEQPGNLFFSSPHVQNIYQGQYRWVVSFSSEITFNENGKKNHGILLVDMNFSRIDEICQKVRLGNLGYIYIIDSKGNIVYHPQQQLINIGLKTENIAEVQKHVFGRYFDYFNGQKRMVTVQTVNYCRWRIVGIAYMDEIVASKKEIAGFIVWIFIFGVLIVMALSTFISEKIASPIKKLEKSMKMVEKGMLDIAVDIKGEEEVVELSKTFNLMVCRLKSLMEQIVLEQEAKRKSELNALQAQINPHFLYNTLDSIVWMAENNNNKGVITMVTALARLFRISISKGRNIITVREELEHAKNYLIIQKIRYKSKFEFEFEVQENVLNCKTMKLILQPIIENAIYHGIEYMVDKGLIKISAEIANGKLLFQVSDNGLGMAPEKLSNILSYESKSNDGSSGVGVKNVHERIQLYFGKEYGLQIESEREVGTTVKIWLPLVENKKEEEK